MPPQRPQKPEVKAARPERKPSEWSPRPVPTPGIGRSTEDPRTLTLRELAARAAQRGSMVADATRVAIQPEDVRPLRETEPQTLEAKKARLAKRRALIQSARERAATMPPGPERNGLLATAARFEDDTRAVDRMRLAKHVYDYHDSNTPAALRQAPVGYRQVTSPGELAQLGLTPEHLQPPGSNFRATVYRSQLEPGGKPIVAFRGTIMNSEEDWVNNFRQGGALESKHYAAALRVGRQLTSRLGRGGFETAGHSLGGGMASAVSAVYGARGDTFNAAGVSEATLRRVGATREDGAGLLDAYHVDGEILTALQGGDGGRRTGPADTLADEPVVRTVIPALGALRQLSGQRLGPDALGRRRTVPAMDPPKYQGRGAANPMKYVNRHLSPMVLAGFEEEKSLDARALGLALRR